MSSEILRFIETIAKDKNIERDIVLQDLESAMASAIRKAYNQEDDVLVTIDRMNGALHATRSGIAVDLKELGRIAAQTAKQVMIQKFRDAERGSIFNEFSEKKGTVITGTVSRVEGAALLVNLGRTEGFLPKSEQIPGEAHTVGQRIRALVRDVREAPHQVKIVLSRSHPDLIRRLFEAEVPEVAERVIEIKALAREAGYRTKVAVASIDSKVDAVGACVGVRGSRIKNIVEELSNEKIDIVRWNESSQILITNALKPAEVQDIALCFELGRATAVVSDDQLSLAIGKRGQNVRLAARLTGWDIDILTPKEYNAGMERLERTIKSIEGMDSVLIEKLSLLGLINVIDVEAVGAEPLVKELGVTEDLAQRIVAVCSVEARKVQEEQEAAKAEAAARKAAGLPDPVSNSLSLTVPQSELVAESWTTPPAGSAAEPGTAAESVAAAEPVADSASAEPNTLAAATLPATEAMPAPMLDAFDAAPQQPSSNVEHKPDESPASVG